MNHHLRQLAVDTNRARVKCNSEPEAVYNKFFSNERTKDQPNHTNHPELLKHLLASCWPKLVTDLSPKKRREIHALLGKKSCRSGWVCKPTERGVLPLTYSHSQLHSRLLVPTLTDDAILIRV